MGLEQGSPVQVRARGLKLPASSEGSRGLQEFPYLKCQLGGDGEGKGESLNPVDGQTSKIMSELLLHLHLQNSNLR